MITRNELIVTSIFMMFVVILACYAGLVIEHSKELGLNKEAQIKIIDLEAEVYGLEVELARLEGRLEASRAAEKAAIQQMLSAVGQ